MEIIIKNSPLVKEDSLWKTPLTITVNEFTEASLNAFRKDFNKALSTGQPIVPIIVDSYGGEVYSLRGFMSIILSSPIPVSTYVDTKAMSCGSFLLGFGTKGYRFASSHATCMIHEVGSYSMGKIQEVKSSAAEAERLNNESFELLAKHCGKTKKFFLDKIGDKKHADWYLTPDDMLEMGIIDKITTPKLITNIKVEFDYQF